MKGKKEHWVLKWNDLLMGVVFTILGVSMLFDYAQSHLPFTENPTVGTLTDLALRLIVLMIGFYWFLILGFKKEPMAPADKKVKKLKFLWIPFFGGLLLTGFSIVGLVETAHLPVIPDFASGPWFILGSFVFAGIVCILVALPGVRKNLFKK